MRHDGDSRGLAVLRYCVLAASECQARRRDGVGRHDFEAFVGYAVDYGKYDEGGPVTRAEIENVLGTQVAEALEVLW